MKHVLPVCAALAMAGHAAESATEQPSADSSAGLTGDDHDLPGAMTAAIVFAQLGSTGA
jgi:hypothetical protein